MKVLLISPYPPLRDGIANYALQVATSLRNGGDDVAVLSPEPSGADWSANLQTVSGIVTAIRRARSFDRTIVQFYPELFFSTAHGMRFYRQWIGASLFLRLSRNVEVLAHETLSKAHDGGRVWPKLWRAFWRQANTVMVHTEAEQADLAQVMGRPITAVQLVDHGAGFERRTSLTRGESRQALGLDNEVFLFLCIGFIQPHKGFDRAVTAMSRLRGDDLRLAIVGEVRVPTPEHRMYLDLLKEMCDDDKRVELREGYVSDESFDMWIVASDVVLLPYRAIWSSSVIERAGLYGRSVIVTDVGGLGSQVVGGGVAVRDPAEFVEAMAQAGSGRIRALEELPTTATPAEVAASRVRQRADLTRRWHDPYLALPPDASRDEDRDAPATSRLPGPLALPPVSPELSVKSLVQRIVRRLTTWQMQPVTEYVNAVRDHMVETELRHTEPPLDPADDAPEAPV